MKAIPYIFTLAIAVLSCEKTADEKQQPSEPVEIEITEKTAGIIESDNAFGFDMFKKVVENDPGSQNIFVSPTSIALALAMTYNGAVGDTKTAFETTLKKQGYTKEEINESYKSLIEALKSVDKKVLLEIANSIWYKEDFNVLPAFINVNQEYYNAEVNSLDFSDPQATAVINGWVNEKTHGLIEKIIEGIPGDVVMYLINAIYFKGAWKYEFDKTKTYDGPFYPRDGSEVTAEMMKQSTTLQVMTSEKFSMAELPYGQGNYSMLVLLPNDGFATDDIIGSLTQENWDSWIQQLQERNVDLIMPKFKFEYRNLLNNELTDLGLGIAFSGADFSGINGTGGLQISRVIHKSFVEVNEEGTEAAAVTAVEMELVSAPSEPQNILFKADHPFIFAIRETTTGAILFLGRVQNPLATINGTDD